ncbi:MAG: amino acid permease [Microscillaceae bacterium]|nr:amino acid permease [Microscillaceae bacterium]MDW8460050.1 amino acid permease [Cytophagales bacterium]
MGVVKSPLLKVSFRTAIAIVVANMIGSGVFTSLGFQIVGFESLKLGSFSTFPLLMLWVVGGIIALCGALSYGEMAALFPRSGGEYNYLSNTYHPAFGFLSGWVSAMVGFSAPVALAAVSLGKYASNVLPFSVQISSKIGTAELIGVLVVLIISAIHAKDIRIGSLFQQYSTAVKVLLIAFFIVGGLLFTPSPQEVSVLPQNQDWNFVFSGAFAVSLAWVSFAYSGWNAAAYLANEIENPRVNVPKALLVGTLIVMTAYVLLNFVFLYTAPINKISGQLEVGYVSAQYFLGQNGAKIMASIIALLLISSISAMVFAGPRVTQAMGEDLKMLGFLGVVSKNQIPVRAIILQSCISIVLILTAQFDAILYAIAFTLDIFTFSTVLGVFVMRFKKPQAERVYKTWGYPITPLVFLLATGWTMYFLLTQRTYESLVALGVVLLGLVVYFVDKALFKK